VAIPLGSRLNPRAPHERGPYGRVGSQLVAEVGLVADRRQGRCPADTWADTTASHGRLMLAVLGGLAAFERDLMRARTTEGRAHIATGGQGPQFLSKPTHVPALSTAGVRHKQPFTPAIGALLLC